MRQGATSLAKRRSPGRIVAAAFACVMLAGCVTTDEPGPKSIPLPGAAPRVVGATNGETAAHAQLVAAFGGAYRSPRIESALNDIVRKLVAASDDPSQQYDVTILNNQTINAFALPSGRLYVTRGLLALANDTSEIAAVLSHEIAHVTARHALARGELERNADLIRRVSVNLLNDSKGGDQEKARSRLTLASFSRLQELEADQIGIRTMAKAGYDPHGAVRFLQSLGRSGAFRTSAARVDFLATHPSTPERIQKALSAARQIGGPGVGESSHDGWLKVIDGMAYGDDRASGLIRGRLFINPDAGYQFTAPEGFALERSGDSIIGRTEDGRRAMRFDRIAQPAGQTPEAHLKAGLLDDVAMEDIRSLRVAAFPAATAIGRSKDWSYRFGVIEMNGSFYRMMFSAETLSPEWDRAFLAAIESFQRLTPEAAQAARPTHIGLVTAAPGESAAALASRMAVADRPLERFLVLNGLDSAAQARPGQAYKIVAE